MGARLNINQGNSGRGIGGNSNTAFRPTSKQADYGNNFYFEKATHGRSKGGARL